MLFSLIARGRSYVEAFLTARRYFALYFEERDPDAPLALQTTERCRRAGGVCARNERRNAHSCHAALPQHGRYPTLHLRCLPPARPDSSAAQISLCGRAHAKGCVLISVGWLIVCCVFPHRVIGY